MSESDYYDLVQKYSELSDKYNAATDKINKLVMQNFDHQTAISALEFENENLLRTNLDNAAWFDQLKADYDSIFQKLRVRNWTKEMDRAWNLAIPDTIKAFDDILTLLSGSDVRNHENH